MPPRKRAHPTYARTFLLVGRYEHLQPVVVTQLPEMPSTENVAADGPVAHHHVAFSRRARHRRQHRLFLISALSRRRLQEIPTSCFSLLVSATEPTCTPSQRQSSPLRARLTFSLTGIFPSGDARAACSRTRASSCAPSFRTPVISFSGFENCHQLLPSKRQRWGGTCKPHDGPDAGNGRQRAPKQLG